MIKQFVDDNTFRINTQLSIDETYADILPVRQKRGDHRAFISVMRGCNNMCAFCIVPFTRGRERSRPIDSILNEVRQLRDEGVKVAYFHVRISPFWAKTSTAIMILYQVGPASI